MSETQKYVGLLPVQKGEYSVGIQRLRDYRDEIAALHARHFAETEEGYLNAKFDADYDRYIASEERGDFVIFTLRENSTLIGYLQYYVFRSMHSSQQTHAKEDAFYIVPEARGRKLAPFLLETAEYFLQKLGCRYVGMTSKHPVGGSDLRNFLDSKGYKQVATYHVKELES
jgi:GNAT superfamily N-acetyltransferase